jgi:hypothetical protein
MNGSESGGDKVFGRFTEPAHRVLSRGEEATRALRSTTSGQLLEPALAPAPRGHSTSPPRWPGRLPLVVHPLGDAIAADQHVKEQLDGQDRVALRTIGVAMSQLKVNGSASLGRGLHEGPSRSVVTLALNQCSAKVSCQTTMSP